VCLLEMLCLAILCLGIVMVAAPAAFADGPGGNVADPVVRAVDIAEPAVVRIITQGVGQLTVNFPGGQRVTFPRTPQNGVNGYPFQTSGTGSFISARGDILTADHVVNPPPDVADQLAAQDVADYINQNLHPAQPVSANDVFTELATGQLVSTPQYTQVQSIVFLSTAFSGPLSATSFQNIPASQYARMDKIVEQTSFNATDTAIIHVNGMDDMPMLQLGDPTGVQQQDKLTIIGFPGNGDLNNDPTGLLTLSINQIYVSAIKPNNGATVIQVGGNVEHGDSGGPALNANGQVVGVVSFGVSDGSGGQTSFLQTSSTAKQLLQQAGISTAPGALQQAWSKAFNDYAANIPGHWHQSMREFQQIINQYPLFKAVNPFLQYATQQAKSEVQTQENNSSGSPSPTVGSGGLSPLPFIIGGAVVIVFLFGGIALSRRHKPVAAPPMAGYGFPPTSGYNHLPAQPYAGSQPGQGPSAGIPQTPAYPGQSGYQQAAYSGQAQPQAGYSGQSQPQVAYSGQSQPAVSPSPAPQPVQPQFQQPGYRSGQSSPPPTGLAAFGAPPATPHPGPSASDSTILARTRSAPQWRTWPCGHLNRDDARFCGTCGEPAPPPLVRRVEQ
jgi:S1-C subfamily serine protease